MNQPAVENELPGKEPRNLAMLCHLLALSGLCVPFGHLLGPLILWALKREEHPYIDDQGREAVNFQLTMTIVLMVVFMLMFLLVGFLLLPVFIIYQIVLIVMAAVAANEGRSWRYPATIRFLK